MPLFNFWVKSWGGYLDHNDFLFKYCWLYLLVFLLSTQWSLIKTPLACEFRCSLTWGFWFSPSDACELELDSNTVSRNLRLSSSRRKVELSVCQMYPDHLERFDYWPQVLCKNALTSRCYWEVKWRGLVDIAVSYRGIDRKGAGIRSLFGGNDKSWTLRCFSDKFAVFHNKKQQRLPVPSCVSSRIAVFVDHPAGVLSFYMVSSDTQIHLYTFNTTFTEPLYAGFGCDLNTSLNFLSIGSSVSVCPLLVDESVKPAPK